MLSFSLFQRALFLCISCKYTRVALVYFKFQSPFFSVFFSKARRPHTCSRPCAFEWKNRKKGTKSGTFLVGGPGKSRKKEIISKTCGGILGTGCQLSYPIEVTHFFCVRCSAVCSDVATSAAVRTPPCEHRIDSFE